jgi:hypothetical protein
MLVVVFKVGLSMMVVLLKIVALQEMLLLFKIEYGVDFVQRLYDR